MFDKNSIVGMRLEEYERCCGGSITISCLRVTCNVEKNKKEKYVEEENQL